MYGISGEGPRVGGPGVPTGVCGAAGRRGNAGTRRCSRRAASPAAVAAGRGTVLGAGRELVAGLVEQRAAALRTVAAGVLERGQARLRGRLGAGLAGAAAATTPVPTACPAGHVPAQRLGLRDPGIPLTRGEVAVVRQCGACPACHQTWAPLARQWGGAPRGRSPRLVEARAGLGAELPFAPAADRLAGRCGVRGGARQVAAVTAGRGRTLAAQQAAASAAACPTHRRAPRGPPWGRGSRAPAGGGGP
jgi:hypothetical protein